MNRREFLNRWIRTGLLGGMALLAGVFAVRGKIVRPGECDSAYQCRSCGKLNECQLTESKNYRKNARG